MPDGGFDSGFRDETMIGNERKGDEITLLIMDQDIPISFLLNRRVFTLVLIYFDGGNVLKLERYRQD